MKLGYLGPKGSFSEQAALKAEECSVLSEYHTIKDVIEAVEYGEIDEGIVPIENSTDGTINVTVDSLIFDSSLFIKKWLIMR